MCGAVLIAHGESRHQMPQHCRCQCGKASSYGDETAARDIQEETHRYREAALAVRHHVQLCRRSGDQHGGPSGESGAVRGNRLEADATTAKYR